MSSATEIESLELKLQEIFLDILKELKNEKETENIKKNMKELESNMNNFQKQTYEDRVARNHGIKKTTIQSALKKYSEYSTYFFLDKNGLYETDEWGKLSIFLDKLSQDNKNHNVNQIILKGNKRKCEVYLINLLNLLKLKLKKASLHIMQFFIQNLKPLIGFRRQRLGRRKQKKKEIRYFFKLYGHNLR